MSDYEMISLMLKFMGIVLTIMIAYIASIKNNRPGQGSVI